MEVTEPPHTTVCLLTTELRANITKCMCFITTDASAPTVTASPLTEEGKINVSWTVPSVSQEPPSRDIPSSTRYLQAVEPT